MRVLLVGAGGVGTAVTRIAARRSFFDAMVVADYDPARAEAAVAALGGEGARFRAERVDAGDEEAVAELLGRHDCDVLLNATDPRFVMPLFRAARRAGATYLDMAMSLSHPHAERPYEECGVKLGDDQFAQAEEWEKAGALALVGMGVEPGMSDVFARFAADELFDEIEEIGIRDGANLTVDGYDFAPSFSIWTTIEECLNPPVVYEADRGWFTTEPFSEPEVFDFPEGIGPVECVNVEHEEVLLVPRWVQARRVTFKYGLGREFIETLKTLHLLGLDRTGPVTVPSAAEPVAVSPGTWSPRACPTRRRWASGCTARPARAPGCAAPRTGSRARCTCTTWSTTSGPWRSTAARRWCGRRPSIRSSPSNSSPPAPGRARASSVRRRSRPTRSWTC